MKKKIAIALAAVMTASMLPMSVFAVSSNRVNRTVTVKQDEYTTKDVPVLSIDPNDEITTNTVIKITLENAEWSDVATTEMDFRNAIWQGNTAIWQNVTYGKTWDDYERETTAAKNTVLEEAINNYQSIPWKLAISSGDKKTAIVTLAPITSKQLKDSTTKDSTYDIPLNVKATNEGDIKVTVDGGGTVITSSTHTFATGTSSSGATVTTVSEVATGRDYVAIKPVAIKETVAKTIKAGDSITLQLSGNFEFVNGQGITLASDYKMANKSVDLKENQYSFNGDTITFTVPADYVQDTSTRLDTLYISRTRISGYANAGLLIAPLDEDTDYGDINLIIKGSNVTKETIKVGERKDYGFDMKVLKDAPTILAARLGKGYPVTNTGSTYPSNATGVDEDQTESAQIHFKETIVNTWLTSRKLTFSVPDGVKISKVDIDNMKQISGLNNIVTYSKDGKSISLVNPDIVGSRSEGAEFKMKVWLSAEAGFEGDVTLDVAGAGITAGTVPGVVIAKVIAPVTVESTTTSTNLGYQKVSTADIKVTEAAAGTFIKGKELAIELDSIYGSSELGFADEGITYEINGDMTIKDFKVKNGKITMTIDRESKTGPSSITFKNIKIGSTRSVPFGTYDILVTGNSFITNYAHEYNGGWNDTNLVTDYFPVFNDNKGYKFKEYIKVVTDVGTLDEVVKVSIGSATCLINDVANEMDVAPYIQTASGSTMVPLRFVSLALGIDSVASADESSKIQWDPNTKTVTIFYAAGTSITPIQFTAGSSNMVVGGTVIPMVSPSGQQVKAEITDSRMFVPFRALGDALGVKVTWDDATRTAIYNQK